MLPGTPTNKDRSTTDKENEEVVRRTPKLLIKRVKSVDPLREPNRAEWTSVSYFWGAGGGARYQGGERET